MLIIWEDDSRQMSNKTLKGCLWKPRTHRRTKLRDLVLLTLVLLNTTCHVLANSVDPDQLASEEVNWSGSALFVIKYVNFYQKPASSYLIGWKLEVGVAF